MTIITREGMEKALQQNYDNEDTEAEHIAQASYVKEYLRTVLAEQVFKAPDDLSGAMKEHWARQSEEFKQHLKAMKESIRLKEKDNFRRKDNDMYCSQFQSLTKAGAI